MGDTELSNKIIRVTPENISDHPQAICFINPKNEYFNKKVEWFTEQYKNGMTIKLLYIDGVKKPVGFIEYVPGEFCWRSVDARDHMFIHCLWTYGKKHQHKGLGSLLIKEAEKDSEGMTGVAVVTSDNSFMANKTIFLKNGYQIVSEDGKNQLLVKQFKKGTLPSFKISAEEPERYKGLTILYSRQCPWVARFIEEVKPILKKENISATIIEIKSAKQAQNTPSVYSVFNMIYNGRILADRYISTTRFINIVRKGERVPGNIRLK